MKEEVDTNRKKWKKDRLKVSSIRPSFYGYHSELIIKLSNQHGITTHTLIVAMAEMLNKQDGKLPQELINAVQEFRPPKS